MADIVLDKKTFEVIEDNRDTQKYNAKEVMRDYSLRNITWRESFEDKQQALHDMVEDGDGFTREEIRDLVLTANKAVWQESKNG